MKAAEDERRTVAVRLLVAYLDTELHLWPGISGRSSKPGSGADLPDAWDVSLPLRFYGDRYCPAIAETFLKDVLSPAQRLAWAEKQTHTVNISSFGITPERRGVDFHLEDPDLAAARLRADAEVKAADARAAAAGK